MRGRHPSHHHLHTFGLSTNHTPQKSFRPSPAAFAHADAFQRVSDNSFGLLSKILVQSTHQFQDQNHRCRLQIGSSIPIALQAVNRYKEYMHSYTLEDSKDPQQSGDPLGPARRRPPPSPTTKAIHSHQPVLQSLCWRHRFLH